MQVLTLYRGRKNLVLLKTLPGREPLPVAAVEAASTRIEQFMRGEQHSMVLSLSAGLEVEVRAIDEMPEGQVGIVSQGRVQTTIQNVAPPQITVEEKTAIPDWTDPDPNAPAPFDPGLGSDDPLAMPTTLRR